MRYIVLLILIFIATAYAVGYSQGQASVYEKAKNDNKLNHMRYSN